MRVNSKERDEKLPRNKSQVRQPLTTTKTKPSSLHCRVQYFALYSVFVSLNEVEKADVIFGTECQFFLDR
jgi:hypothetical protein